ncbi:MAG: DUF2272 domain-containing protein [Pseudomonadota bacterium]
MGYKDEFASDTGWSAVDVSVRLNNDRGTRFATYLRLNGVVTVIRYYASTQRPKTLTREEAIFLSEAGFAILPVFQDRNRELTDFSAHSGREDAKSALKFAELVGQPRGKNSTIMFAVDADFSAQDHDRIVDYFAAIKEELNGEFAIGAYGSGAVLAKLLHEELISVSWLSMSRSFRGTEQFFYSSQWSLRQVPPERFHDASEIGFDRNVVRQSAARLGAFQVDASGLGRLASDAHEAAILDIIKQLTFTAPAAGGALRYVTTEGLRFRASPDGVVIRDLTIGEPVTDLGPADKEGWRKIDVAGQHGVAFGLYLRAPVRPEVERLLQAAISEWVRFDKGRANETSSPYHAYIGEMWAAIGKPYDGRSRYADGKEVPWSAAFISWVVRQAGSAYDDFTFAENHSAFVNSAIKARITGRTDKPFWGYRINEEKPALGDIIQRNRENNNFSFSYAENHSSYFSHSDIVVEVTPDVVRVIGGNISDTVTLSGSPQEYDLDAAGYIRPNQRVIALLKNRAGLPPAE